MEIILYQAPKVLEPIRVEVAGSGVLDGGWQVGQACHLPPSNSEPGLISSNFHLFKKPFSYLGSTLVILAVLGLGSWGIFALKSQAQYYLNLSKYSATARPKIGFGTIITAGIKREPTQPAPPDPNFSLIIPKINASAPVVPNVSASKAKEYNAALKKGIAHAAGTVFPGMKGTTWLFAHSASAPWDIRQYNAVFYLLEKMEKGDSVVVYYLGKRFNYEVTEKKIIAPSETNLFKQNSEELLVLQTCYPPGTTQKILLVVARPLGEI